MNNNNDVVCCCLLVCVVCGVIISSSFDCNITSTHPDFSALVSLSIASASRAKSQTGAASIFKSEARLETIHCYAVRG